MDLLSLVLTLRPHSPTTAPVPVWWGRAAHALLLRIVQQQDAMLSAALHDDPNALRPFTASTLMGSFPQHALDPQGVYTLRLTAMTEPVSAALMAALQPGGALQRGAVLDLDGHTLRVEDQAWQEAQHPWAGNDTYQALSGRFLLGRAAPPRAIRMQFTAPTAFKTQERTMPLPLAEQVFRSLLERWNAFAPLAFPPETVRFAAECLAISRFDLQSRSIPLKQGGLRIGAVGSITYTALTYDRYWLSVLHTLAEFARYAAVGSGGSMGLGQARCLSSAEAASNEDAV